LFTYTEKLSLFSYSTEIFTVKNQMNLPVSLYFVFGEVLWLEDGGWGVESLKVHKVYKVGK